MKKITTFIKKQHRALILFAVAAALIVTTIVINHVGDIDKEIVSKITTGFVASGFVIGVVAIFCCVAYIDRGEATTSNLNRFSDEDLATHGSTSPAENIQTILVHY
ncbi:hypothetical protein MHBO_001306 [Bonamia ostreae]|uniref:Uncharacterized protein n=1 Tax=Bonamia ostreae TaxID=126728 RepID=A0ABV2AII0_9EUKA